MQSHVVMKENHILQRAKHDAGRQVLVLKCLVYPPALLLMWSAVLCRTSINQGRGLIHWTLGWWCPARHTSFVLWDAQRPWWAVDVETAMHHGVSGAANTPCLSDPTWTLCLNGSVPTTKHQFRCNKAGRPAKPHRFSRKTSVLIEMIIMMHWIAETGKNQSIWYIWTN